MIHRYLSEATPDRIGDILDDPAHAREILSEADEADPRDVSAALLSLAAEGTDAALLALQGARGRVPEELRGALQAALVECQFRHFQIRVDALVSRIPHDLPAERTPLATQEVLRAVHNALAEECVRVELPEEIPAHIRGFFAAGVLDLVEQYDFGSEPFIVVDGCTGACDPCFQNAYCPVYRLVTGASAADEAQEERVALQPTTKLVAA